MFDRSRVSELADIPIAMAYIVSKQITGASGSPPRNFHAPVLARSRHRVKVPSPGPTPDLAQDTTVLGRSTGGLVPHLDARRDLGTERPLQAGAPDPYRRLRAREGQGVVAGQRPVARRHIGQRAPSGSPGRPRHVGMRRFDRRRSGCLHIGGPARGRIALALLLRVGRRIGRRLNRPAVCDDAIGGRHDLPRSDMP